MNVEVPATTRRASISVIVPVRNEERFLSQTLDQLLTQEREGIQVEIIVVDGMSTDRTKQIACDYASRYPEVRVLENPNQFSSSGRNLAIRNSSGEYVLIVDGHCEIATRQYFIALIDAFERTGADCLGRPQPLDVTNATLLQKAIAEARASVIGHHPQSYVYSRLQQFVPAESVAVAYRRSVFDRVGYFDEQFDACEDLEFNYRVDTAGIQCYLTPAIAVRYYPRSSLWGLFVQLFRYGRGRIRFIRKHPTALYRRRFLAVALGLVLAAVFGMVMWTNAARPVVMLLPFIAYVIVLSFVAARVAIARRNLLFVPLVPLALFTTHVGGILGIVVEALSRQRDHSENAVICRTYN